MKEIAQERNYSQLLNWLTHKEGQNEWILKCVSPATSRMNKNDWYATSMTTNRAESAHANGQRDGTHGTLIAAIQLAKKMDQRFWDAKYAANRGVMSRHGNQTITGRTERNLKRSKKVAQKKTNPTESIFMMAQSLIEQGVSKDIVELVMKDKMKKSDM